MTADRCNRRPRALGDFLRLQAIAKSGHDRRFSRRQLMCIPVCGDRRRVEPRAEREEQHHALGGASAGQEVERLDGDRQPFAPVADDDDGLALQRRGGERVAE